MATALGAAGTLVAMLLCCISIYSIECATPGKKAEQSAAGLYDTIRRIASPELKEATEADGRFIMMMPGKILNHFDYNPGIQYTEFVQNPDKNKKFAIVPPHVMEKWFDLADVIPSANPLNGQDTGRSLANIYRSILTRITIKNLKDQGEAVQSLYNQAIGFLNEVLPHPEQLTQNTTRLSLYNEYKEMYNDRRLEMEDKIEERRKNLQYLDYELWFQRFYPSLLAKVESAYVRWLIFGQKELCDIYITYLDTGASAKALEEARVVLRSAGVTSLDRTRTIYPVSFEPSDWYKYLIPPVKKPSRTELQEMLGRIDSKISTIESMIAFYKSHNYILDRYSNQLAQRKNVKSKNRNNTLFEYLQTELKCTVMKMGVNMDLDDPCNQTKELSKNVTDDMASEADAMANVGDYNWDPKSKAAYIKSLENETAELDRKRGLVLGALGQVDPLVGSILNSDPIVIAGIIDSHKDDNWMEFQFNSEDYNQSSDYQSSFSQTSASARVGSWWFRAGYSYSRSQSSTSYSNSMSRSSMKAKGKLLRVHIKRPWFKPEVFDDRNLEFVSVTDDSVPVRVSPGKRSTSIDGDDFQYLLPEYVTSFLLARDVELEFSNVERSAFRNTVSTFTRHSARASFLFFSASFSSSKRNYNSRSSVHRTSNGMVIKIPGAQIIGYYTQKLPKFPAT